MFRTFSRVFIKSYSEMLLLILLGIILTLCAVHYYVRGGRIGKYIDKIPGPPCWPFVGNLPAFMVPYGIVYKNITFL